jgi:NAD+ kinase
MRIAIIGISYTSAHTDQIRSLLHSITSQGHTLCVRHDHHEKLESDISCGHLCETLDELSPHKDINVYVSIGGDGTLLNSIGVVSDSCIPILGINTGRMGYLTSASLSDAAEAIGKIAANDFIIDKRSLLRIETSDNIFGKINYALNDFAIIKNDSTSMITVHAHVNGVFLNSYWGDGLIVATPTGSTAYSLSCGGPIVSGECGVFILSPVAPHNLNVRPLVISDDSVLTVTAETRNNYYLASLDSRSVRVESNIEFTLRKENFCLNLVRFKNQDFPSRIRGKLLWGLDQRN